MQFLRVENIRVLMNQLRQTVFDFGLKCFGMKEEDIFDLL